MSRKANIFIASASIAIMLALGWWLVRSARMQLFVAAASPRGIMGTECDLTAVARGSNRDLRANGALEAAETALRNVESLMSVHIKTSELSRFNTGDKGEYRFSPELMNVLRAAGEFHKQTNRAFDVTCYPLIRLWKKCKADGRLPSERQIAETLGRVGMKHLRIAPGGVTKLTDGVSIDLGAIAKGYGIDRAVRAMIDAGAAGGMVNVGGDLRCFGSNEGDLEDE